MDLRSTTPKWSPQLYRSFPLDYTSWGHFHASGKETERLSATLRIRGLGWSGESVETDLSLIPIPPDVHVIPVGKEALAGRQEAPVQLTLLHL